MGLIKKFIPGTGIPLPPRPGSRGDGPAPTDGYTGAPRPPAMPQGGGDGGGGSVPWSPSGGAGAGGGASSAGGFSEVKNPWDLAMQRNYGEASAPVPYKAQWGQGVDQAMALGNRDYEGSLRGFAQEDVNRQITSADNQLGQLGMRELALRGDVQADRGKMRSDASTRAMIDSQGIKSNALQTMQGMLGAASGVELDRISQMISAASAGAGNYNQFTSMMLPLQERYGENQAAAANQRRAEKNQASAQRAARNAAGNAESARRNQAEAARRAAAKAAVGKGRGGRW